MLSLSSSASRSVASSSSSGFGGNPPLSWKAIPGAKVATWRLSWATVCVWLAVTRWRLPSAMRTCSVVVGADSSTTSGSDGVESRAFCASSCESDRAIASCSSSLMREQSTSAPVPAPAPPPPPPPRSALPAGWETHEDDSSGAIYFFNSLTGETTWERPG
mmetsp:Transcript_26833/g.68289  ORF Transcript_26833/g.68289 Transcript_26833/m.68289 type:complete len:161 (-) Transcript_26833:239-721(-)